MAEKIPIQLTHEDAKQLLEVRHAIDYETSILGGSVRARCACGWTSPWSLAGWLAQEVAQRHRIAHIIHPIENRARYAIFWKPCPACNGSGRFETRDGVDQGECAHCYEGGLWTILDRTDEDLERYAVSQEIAMQRLWDDLRFETEAGR